MTKMEDLTLITTEEYRRLQDSLKWLAALEAAGVDNWEGIDHASELYNDYRDDE